MTDPMTVDAARQRILALVGEDYPILNAIVDLERAIRAEVLDVDTLAVALHGIFDALLCLIEHDDGVMHEKPPEWWQAMARLVKVVY